MPLPLTQLSDYQVGRYKAPLNQFDAKDLLSDLPFWEDKYLCDLLGNELMELFIADLDSDNVPQTERFQKIYNKLVFIDHCQNVKRRSLSMLDMIKGFVLFEFSIAIENQSSLVGTKGNKSENSKKMPMSSSKIPELYNHSIDYYEAIQVYICQNYEDYPEFAGVVKTYLSII